MDERIIQDLEYAPQKLLPSTVTSVSLLFSEEMHLLRKQMKNI